MKTTRKHSLNSLSMCILVLGLSLIALTGCSRFDMRKNIPWGEGKVGKTEPPGKIVAFWSDTVLHQNGKAVRGFGGRVLFYEREDGDPIRVDGTLEIYAFDENFRDPANPKPDRKFVFTPEQVAGYYSKNKAGHHSYSFWIPWDEARGERKEISLIARFTPKDGSGIIISQQTRHLLPGTEPLVGTPLVNQKQVIPNPLQTSLAAQATPTQTTTESEGLYGRKMQTDTIQLSPMMSRQLAQPNAQPNTSSDQNSQLTATEQASQPNSLGAHAHHRVHATQPIDGASMTIQRTGFQQTQPVLAAQTATYGHDTTMSASSQTASSQRNVGGSINQQTHRFPNATPNHWDSYNNQERFSSVPAITPPSFSPPQGRF